MITVLDRALADLPQYVPSYVLGAVTYAALPSRTALAAARRELPHRVGLEVVMAREMGVPREFLGRYLCAQYSIDARMAQRFSHGRYSSVLGKMALAALEADMESELHRDTISAAIVGKTTVDPADIDLAWHAMLIEHRAALPPEVSTAVRDFHRSIIAALADHCTISTLSVQIAIANAHRCKTQYRMSQNPYLSAARSNPPARPHPAHPNS